VADGGPPPRAINGHAGRDFRPTIAASRISRGRRSLREHPASSSASFDDPVNRMIGAHLVALLCPAGRLTAEPSAIADAMAIRLGASGRCVRA
jgi:hypothetical protein